MNSPTPDAKSVFGRAAEIPSPTEQAAYLDEACANHPTIRAEVDALLKALGAAGSFMGSPAAPADRTSDYESPISEGEGTVIGPYTLRELIGEGGMGLVFVAEQSQPVRRKVALKVIKPGMDTRQVVARFEAERQALALMDHPHIAKVLDAGTTDAGRPYFVMELVRGVAITEYADANNLTPKDRLALFVQVCQAIQHAHQKGIIHRDLKPSNILVAPHDGVPVVKVIDFGVAKAVGQSLTEKTIYTRFAQMIGTPLYMSPEQAEVNQLDVDTRSDVYSLGVLLYELLTGTTPFDGDRFRKAAFDEVRRIIREEEPPRPSTRLTSLGATLTAVSARRGTDPARLAGLVRGELDWIVMKCLEKDRTRRYDGAAALAKDVQRYLAGDAVEAYPPTLGYRLRKAYRRNRSAVLVSGMFAAILLTAAGVSIAFAVQARRAEAEARANAELASGNAVVADARLTELEAKTADLNRTTDLQVLTRYAAEMNLLQAAYDAKNMPEVKRLLLAQIPKPGEQDLRGPEWHYWHRKLNGQTGEFRIEYARGAEWPLDRMGGHADQIAFSPDGTRIATSARIRDDTATIARYILRVFDADTGRQLHETILDDERLGLTDGRRLSRHNHPRFKFGRDGRQVLIESLLDDKNAGFGPYGRATLYSLWDLVAGTVRPSGFQSSRSGMMKQQRFRVVSHTISDDLAWMCEAAEREDSASVSVRVCRFDTPDKVFTYSGPPGTHAVLSPDGRHVMLIRPTQPVPVPEIPKPPAVGADLAYYRVGEEMPLWTRPLDFRVSTRQTDEYLSHFWFQPDGSRFNILARQDGFYSRVEIGVATGAGPTGKEGSTAVRLCPETHDSLAITGWVANWAWQRTRTDATNTRLAFPSRYGVEVAGLRLPGKDYLDDVTSGMVRVESIDGPPVNITFRPDGTMLTVHRDDRFLIVRCWPNPATLVEPLNALVSLNGAEVSPDGTRFAIAVPKQLTDRNPEFGSNVARVVVFSSRGERVLDIDCSGEVAQAAAPLKRFLAEEGDIFNRFTFSADSRQFLMLQTVQPAGGTPHDQLVAWDLNTRQPRTLIRFDPGERVAQATLHPNRDRVLLCMRGRGKDADLFRAIVAARMYDLATGRPLFDLVLPPGEKIGAIRMTADGYEAHDPSPRGPIARMRWNFGGEYLGVTDGRPIWRAGELHGQSEAIRGSRFVRTTEALHASGAGVTGRLEVWDTARRGSGDRPLFTLESDIYEMGAYLSPDGRRLIVRRTLTNTNYREMVPFEMYDTTTGRLLLRLPYLGPWTGGSGSGVWAADGTAFWRRMTPDGRFSGYDFRPLEPSK